VHWSENEPLWRKGRFFKKGKSMLRKLCCSRLALRISMLIMDTFGRLNFGAMSEQAATTGDRAIGQPRASRNKIRVGRGTMPEMIPTIKTRAVRVIALCAPLALNSALADTPPAAPVTTKPLACLASGDGYLHAEMGGAIEARIDWPNSGTRCEGESRDNPPGVRLSFQRPSGAVPNLLLVFGLTGVRQGEAAREVKANLTIIEQGTSRIFGTLGDSRCTVDSLSQRPLAIAGSYRLEARGFCTQPAHAVRGKGDVLVSTFEFAGPVTFYTETK
jgi:hypothetical protein